MIWAAPLWLLALLPWSAVVLYLLWGRRPRVDVPFLDLWPAPGDEAVKIRRRATPPPVALALAILATLLGVLAAGRPAVRSKGVGEPITRIFDRGYTMSARGENGTRLQQVLRDASFPSDIQVIPETSGDIAALTAADTHVALNDAVRRALGEDGQTRVVVLSDQALGVADERIIQIPPDQPIRNARIVLVSARETPTPQVMVRLRATAGMNAGKLRVSSGGQTVEREVTLPEKDHDEFIDLPRLDQTIKAELLIDDDQPADNTAWLVREASWPRIEARVPLPLHLQRMIEVYARQRPPSESSKTVVLVSSIADLPEQSPGVVLTASEGRPAEGKIETKDHPITKGVTWSDIGAPPVALESPPADWNPIVSMGGKVLVAVRKTPSPAVWIGFDSSAWARSTEFVVFWANVLNWAGAGAERFASYPVGTMWEGQWSAVELAGSVAPPQRMLWPGLYRRTDGVLRALHTPDVPLPTSMPTDWRQRLSRLRDHAAGRYDLSPVLACLAIVCLAGAAGMWKRRAPIGRQTLT